MDIRKKYIVYEFNRVMGSEKHMALEKVSFKGLTSNYFDTEEEAIEALVKDKRTYEDYVILRTVYID